MADFANILDGFGSNTDRVRLLTSVLSLLKGDAIVESKGGASALCTLKPVVPSSEGINDNGSLVEAIVAELDCGDRFAGVATAARTSLALYDAHVEWSPGIQALEDEHGRDAVVRLVGLGLVAEGLSEESSDAAAEAWLATEAGRACLAWFAAVEVVLAYATDDEPIDGDKLLDLLDTFFDEAIDDWSEIAGDTGLARARIIVNNWTDVLCPAINAAADSVGNIAEAVRSTLGVGGDVDALAAEAKALGIYRTLTAWHLGEMLHGSSGAPMNPPVPEEQPEPESTEPTVASSADKGVEEKEAQIAAARGEAEARVEALRVVKEHVDQRASRMEVLEQELLACMESRQVLNEKCSVHESERASLIEESGEVVRSDSAPSAITAEKVLNSARMALEKSGDQRLQLKTSVTEAKAALKSARALLAKEARAHATAAAEQRRLTQQRLSMLHDLSSVSERVFERLVNNTNDLQARRQQTKTALFDLRKERRRLGKSTATTSRQEGAVQKQIDAGMAMVDASRLSAREARDEVKRCLGERKKSAAFLSKRVERVQALEKRQLAADSSVEDIAQEISSLREELAALMTQVEARRAEREATRQTQLVGLRKQLSLAQECVDTGTERLPKMKADSKLMREQITGLIDMERKVIKKRDQAASTLHELQSRALSDRKQRKSDAELAVAALDMLRANAKRLEEAHATYRNAQSELDGFFKEQNFSTSKRESLERNADQAHVDEEEAQSHIESCKGAVDETKRQLEQNASDIVAAHKSIEQDRRERVEALTAKVAASRDAVVALQEECGDAQEDLRGLLAAEEKVNTGLAKLSEERASVTEHKNALLNQQTNMEQQRAASARHVGDQAKAISTIRSSITGAQLTIKGLVADRDSRRKRIVQFVARIEHLSQLLNAAQTAESEAVEEVADYQSWVDRSRASVARTKDSIAAEVSAVPAPPSVPQPPAKSGSKIERLLAEIQKEKRTPPAVKNPGATLVLEREDLIAQAAVDDQATRILSQSSTVASVPSSEDDEDATVIFSPEELRRRLAEEEAEEDETVIFRRPTPASPKDKE